MLTAEWLRDTAERVAATWAEAFVALLLAGWTTTVDVSPLAAAAWAAIPAGLATLKAAIATRRGNPATASFADPADPTG